MLCVNKEVYNQYIEDIGISKEWMERDFVEDVKKYINSMCKKVLLVSGLKGTGKSVGKLQNYTRHKRELVVYGILTRVRRK